MHDLLKLFTLIIFVSGCTTATYFEKNRYAMPDVEVCDAASEAIERKNQDLLQLSTAELNRRRITSYRCVQLTEARRRQMVDSVKIVALGVVTAGATNRISGGTYVATVVPNVKEGQTATQTDDEADWDEFIDQTGAHVWVCKGVQSLKPVSSTKCQGLPQTDNRWPQKTAF